MSTITIPPIPPTIQQPYFGDPSGVTALAMREVDAANNYILQLGTLGTSMTPPVIDPVFPTVGDAPTPLTTSAPAMQQVVWVAPSLPTAFSGTLTIDQYMPAPFDESPPTLVYGSAPQFTLTAPDAPGVNLQFEYPDLTVDLPAPPNLLSLAIMPFDGVTMPTIDENVPVLNLQAPSIREYIPGQMYTSSLLTALTTSLQDRIQNGGTGLSPAVEQGIWDRGREREYRQMSDALADLERMEVLGYAFPPGVYIDARIKIQTEMGYASFGYSREVAIEQAKLEQSNVLAALETATQVEANMIQYSNQVEQRLFDSCRYATEAGISIYNAQVQSYAAYLDAYKTKVAIYEAKIRGELAKVEAYRTEIAAEQAKAEINTALVNQYQTQSEVALSAIEVFKAEIGAIQAKAEIEKLKIDIFGEQVRGYAAQVSAYTAGVEGFRATIQAETAKQEAYRSQVAAYAAKVEAAAKQADARIAEYRGRIDAKTVEWDAYKSQVQAEASRAQSIAASNSTLADAYRSEVTGVSAYNDTLTKQWQATLEQAQRTAEIGVSAAKANSDLFLTTRGLALDAAKVGAQVSAQLGAAALNAINWSFSNSNASSQSQGYSLNESYSYSTAYSESKSESENYNYSV